MNDMTEALYKWVDYVEKLIKRHTITQPIIGEQIGEVSKGWMFELILHITTMHKKNKDADGCLWHGFWLGAVLLSWYFRTAYAKTCDPRRSLEDRERALNILNIHVHMITEMLKYQITDADKKIYDQEWEPIIELDYNDFKDLQEQIQERI